MFGIFEVSIVTESAETPSPCFWCEGPFLCDVIDGREFQNSLSGMPVEWRHSGGCHGDRFGILLRFPLSPVIVVFKCIFCGNSRFRRLLALVWHQHSNKRKWFTVRNRVFNLQIRFLTLNELAENIRKLWKITVMDLQTNKYVDIELLNSS